MGIGYGGDAVRGETLMQNDDAKPQSSPELVLASDELKLYNLSVAERERMATIRAAMSDDDWMFLVRVIKNETTVRNMVQFARTFHPSAERLRDRRQTSLNEPSMPPP